MKTLDDDGRPLDDHEFVFFGLHYASRSIQLVGFCAREVENDCRLLRWPALDLDIAAAMIDEPMELAQSKPARAG